MFTGMAGPGFQFPKLTLGFLLLCAVILMPSVALAEWDTGKFVELQQKADTQYTGTRYSDALQTYKELKVMLETALDNNEIPSDMVDPATQALGTIKYQIGRCLQLTSDCAEAFKAYKTLEDMAALPSDVRAKIDVRMAETMLCIANSNVEGGDYEAAGTNIDKAEKLLSKAGSEATLDQLDEKGRAEVVKDLSEADALHMSMAEEVFDHYSNEVMNAVDSGNCQAAQVGLTRAERQSPETRTKESAALRKAVDDCGEVAPPDLPSDQPGDTPVAAWVMTSIGVAALAGYGTWEILNMDKVSEYEDAKKDCENFQPTCDRTLELADELGTARIVSWSLLGAGTALTLAGATWLVIHYTSSPSSEEATTTFQIAPTPDGAMVGLKWTLP